MFHDPWDAEVPAREGAALAAAWPGSSLRSAESLGHRRLLRDPGVVAESVAFVSAGAARQRTLEEALAEELFDPGLRGARAA